MVGGGTITSIENVSWIRGGEFSDILTLLTQTGLLTVDAGAGDDVIVVQQFGRGLRRRG